MFEVQEDPDEFFDEDEFDEIKWEEEHEFCHIKWLLDGLKSLEEIVARLRAEADYLEGLDKDGYILEGNVVGGHFELKIPEHRIERQGGDAKS